MQSAKLLGLFLISLVFLTSLTTQCIPLANRPDSNCNQRSVTTIINRGRIPVQAIHTVEVPTHTKATITTELVSLKPSENLSLELLKAILKDDTNLVRSAFQAGADVNREICNKRPLIIATIHNKDKAFEKLLDLGANYNIMHEEQTLVRYCITTSRNHLATLLVKRGADFSRKPGKPVNETTFTTTDCSCECSNNSKNTRDIMWFVVHHENVELAKELFNRGYNTNEIANETNFYLPLHPDILELFLRNGFNPNAVIKLAGAPNGPWTPLTIAASSNQIQSAKLLLEAGADASLAAPKTPLFYAIDRGCIEMIELLQTYGAEPGTETSICC